MAEVVGLRGSRITDGRTPDPEVVKLLEDMLERAKSGELTGVAMTVNYFDRATYAKAAGTCSWATIGRLHYLINRSIKALEEA